MNNVYFGIFIGIFLCFAAQHFFVFAKKALKERKENEAKRAEEAMEKMIERVITRKGE